MCRKESWGRRWKRLSFNIALSKMYVLRVHQDHHWDHRVWAFTYTFAKHNSRLATVLSVKLYSILHRSYRFIFAVFLFSYLLSVNMTACSSAITCFSNFHSNTVDVPAGITTHIPYVIADAQLFGGGTTMRRAHHLILHITIDLSSFPLSNNREQSNCDSQRQH